MFLIALVALVGVAAAVPTKPGCCLPSQWEGFQGGVLAVVAGGKPTITTENFAVSYDEINQKIAYTTDITTEGQTQNSKLIYDYGKKLSFVANLKAQQCVVSPLTTPFQKFCLPADAQPTRRCYYGIGDEKLTGLSFDIRVNRTKITSVLTEDDCIPISEVAHSGNGQGSAMMQVFGFVDLTLGIKNSSVFIPPSYCTQGKPAGFHEVQTRRGVVVF